MRALGLAILMLCLGCGGPPEPADNKDVKSLFDSLDKERRAMPAPAGRDTAYNQVRENERQNSEIQRRIMNGEDPNKVLAEVKPKH